MLRERARRAIDAGLRVRNGAAASSSAIFESNGLDRPRKLAIDAELGAGPPPRQPLEFRAGIGHVASRLFVYAGGAVRWYAGNFADRLRGRDTAERRAVRLRTIIERAGGTAIKIGQQLSMRVDLMPYVYGHELSKMLDDVAPFETSHALARIAAQTGRPHAETFASFDPVPVGSASVACVYQAVLHGGEKVAVKVRRPDIGPQFEADCKAFAVVLGFLEWITVIPPGLSRNFLHEFRQMLMDELDFSREARSAELFRTRTKRDLRNVTAPRVHFDLSGQDVLVTEFVSGVWLRDVIAAVERDDADALAFLSAHGIEPKRVARKLLRTNQYGIFENLLFHADPHPSNVLVRPDNELVFIDFGACGSYTEKERNNWRQIAYYHSREDAGRMAQCALAILEPLPPIDIDEFSRRLEYVFWRDLHAFRSKHTEWHERTSAHIWISFLELSREYGIPMNLNTLRMIRSTLLYETVAARIYPRIDAWREHRRYLAKAGARARKRVLRKLFRRLTGGPTDSDFVRIEDGLRMGNRLFYLARRMLDAPPYRMSAFIGRAAYAAATALWCLIVLAGSAGLAAGAGYLWRRVFHPPGAEIMAMAREVVTSPWWFAWALLVFFIGVRRMGFRLTERENPASAGGLT